MLTYEENLRSILETTTAGVVKDEVISIAILSITKLNDSYYTLKDENELKVLEENKKLKEAIRKITVDLAKMKSKSFWFNIGSFVEVENIIDKHTEGLI